MVDELSKSQHRGICCQWLGRRTITDSRDPQGPSESDGILLIHMQHPPPQRPSGGTFPLRRSWTQELGIPMKANGVRQADSRAKKCPGVEKSTAVCQVWADHDQRLYRKEGRGVHERCET